MPLKEEQVTQGEIGHYTWTFRVVMQKRRWERTYAAAPAAIAAVASSTNCSFVKLALLEGEDGGPAVETLVEKADGDAPDAMTLEGTFVMPMSVAEEAVEAAIALDDVV